MFVQILLFLKSKPFCGGGPPKMTPLVPNSTAVKQLNEFKRSNEVEHSNYSTVRPPTVSIDTI